MDLRVSQILYTLFEQCDMSLVCQIEGGFLIYKWKNVMVAHRSCRLGDGSFGHPGQMLKWMDLRVSQKLCTLFEQCDMSLVLPD